MPTPPFGVVLETSLKHDLQGGKLALSLGITVDPQFHCCISGTPVMALKDPVAKLKVSPSSACTGMPVTANYASSMSPTSTLVTWSIDWGDGNSSNGAWLGPGSVNHPLGGYAVPAHYQITLTVTDQLGAASTESVTHVALDCTSGIPVEILGGCGASGPFLSLNGGFTWESIGGGVLDGATIYDMKATWFSFGLTIQEVWAATSLGLYKGEVDIATRSATWERISLGTGIVARAIGHSKYAADEVYILANDGGGTPFLYRTEDGGETWASIQLGALQWQRVGVLGGGGIWGNALAWNSVREEMYVGCTGFTGFGTCPGFPWPPFIDNVLRWNGVAWDVPGSGIGEDTAEDFAMDNVTGKLYMAGGFDYQCLTPAYDLVMWDSVNNSYTLWPHPWGFFNYTSAVAIHRGLVWWSSQGAAPEEADIFCRRGDSWVGVGHLQEGTIAYTMASDIHHIYVGGDFTTLTELATARRLVRITDPEGTWEEVGGGIRNGRVFAIAFAANGDLLVGGSFTNAGGQNIVRMGRWNGSTWIQMGEGNEQLNDGSVWGIKVADDGTIFICGSFTSTVGGTILNRVARWDALNEAWCPVGVSGFNATAYALEFDGNNRLWATGWFTSADGNAVEGVARLEPAAATIPALGRTHLVDMDASGGYVYVALLGSGGTPLVLRVAYDLSTIDEAYSTGAGTWGGVACDPYNPARVWVFGNFGATAKVLYTNDWGVTFTNVTGDSWGATELVRPLLLSEWSSQDAVAILNVALECWQTKNDGADWANNGTIDFAAQCGVRDPLEPLNVWIGRAAAGANHIQYSPNVGDDWLEWSTGFTPNAPVTSLQVIG